MRSIFADVPVMVADRCQIIPDVKASQKSLKNIETVGIGKTQQQRINKATTNTTINTSQNEKWKRSRDDRRLKHTSTIDKEEDERRHHEDRSLFEFSRMIEEYKRGK